MKPLRIHLDAHAHIYPFHDVPALLLAALDHMPRIAPTDLRVLCLAERFDCSFFQALSQDEISLPGDRWRIAAWDPAGGVKIRHLPDHRDIWILAGRQIVSAERIEVCSLFSDTPIADGQPARDLIRAILAGSDPLPFPGEEESAGSYHCTFSIPALADPARLVAPLKAALASGSLSIAFGGHRDGPLSVFRRLRRNAQEKKKT